MPRGVDDLVRMVAAAARPDHAGTTGLALLSTRLREPSPTSETEEVVRREVLSIEFLDLLQAALDVQRGDRRGMHEELDVAGYESWSALSRSIAAIKPLRTPALRRLMPMLGTSLARELKLRRPSSPKARCEGWSIVSAIGHPYTVEEVRRSGILDLAAEAPWRTMTVLHGTNDLEPDHRLDALADIARMQVGRPSSSFLAKGFKLFLESESELPKSFLRPRLDRLIDLLEGDYKRDFLASLEDILPGIVQIRPIADPSVVDFTLKAKNR